MYSDPSATNMLGSDAERITIALADRATLGKLLRAKCLVLWLLVAPVCTILTLFIDFGEHHRLTRTALYIKNISIYESDERSPAGRSYLRLPPHKNRSAHHSAFDDGARYRRRCARGLCRMGRSAIAE